MKKEELNGLDLGKVYATANQAGKCQLGDAAMRTHQKRNAGDIHQHYNIYRRRVPHTRYQPPLTHCTDYQRPIAADGNDSNTIGTQQSSTTTHAIGTCI